ncbi:MAG: hydantoinase/carbamoylase family amidase, partial [Bacteroidota bacterium]
GGAFALDYAYDRQDRDGKTLKEELERIGYLGELPVGNRPYAATFEVHIEQGPILEAEDYPVGIVTGVQGIRWYDLVIKGKETHAGPSPMSFRDDPVRKAIPLLNRIYQLAEDFAPDARVTIGYLDATPGVKNTVPGQLTVSLDLRHPAADTLQEMDAQLRAIAAGYDLKDIWHSPPVAFAESCIAAVSRSVEKLGIRARRIVSGAGHDAVYVARVAPTSMIFIPCKDGLSHNEAESAQPSHLTAGADVLLHAVLETAKIVRHD